MSAKKTAKSDYVVGYVPVDKAHWYACMIEVKFEIVTHIKRSDAADDTALIYASCNKRLADLAQAYIDGLKDASADRGAFSYR